MTECFIVRRKNGYEIGITQIKHKSSFFSEVNIYDYIFLFWFSKIKLLNHDFCIYVQTYFSLLYW
jgi:hypothetical protein